MLLWGDVILLCNFLFFSGLATLPQITLNGNPVSSPFCIPRPPTALTFTAVGGTNAVSYTWAYPNTTWQGTQNGSSITLTPNNSNTGNVSVTAVSYSSNCTSNTYGFSTVYAPTPGTITGPTCIAAGNTDALTLGAALTNVTYTVPAVTGATYQWNIPPAMYSGTLPTNPGNSITFTCNGNPSGSPYEISVAVSTSGGCVSTSKISVNVDLRGDVLNSTVGTSSQLLELLKGGVLDNAISGYQWFQWTTGRNNISGNNSNSITLSNAGTAGNYGVEATYNNYGCKNVYAIAGTNYGNKNGQGSKPKMPARQSKAANPTSADNIRLQPNPASNSTTLVLPGDIQHASVSIISAEGKLLWKRSYLNTGSTLINTANWLSGEYTVIVREPNKKAVTKSLIIQKL